MVSKGEALTAGHTFRCMPFTSTFTLKYCFPCSQMTTKHHGMTMSNQLHHNTLVQNRYLPTKLCACIVLHLIIIHLFQLYIYKRGSVAITARTRTPYSYSNLTITGSWLTSPMHAILKQVVSVGNI